MSAQAYDLWRRNCNNFSNDFATFLLGKGIPSYIINQPQTVLESPFGRLLQPTIDDMIKNSQNRRNGGLLGIEDDPATDVSPNTRQRTQAVKIPANLEELDALLVSAQTSCAIIFFISEPCPPCEVLYPLYDKLAADSAHKCTFIKADIGKEDGMGEKFSVHATPTFVTFLAGKEEERWSGHHSTILRENIKSLLEMAWPTHPHKSLRLPKLREASVKPVLFERIPPLGKLLAKIGEAGTFPAVQGVRYFIASSQAQGSADSTLPDLDGFSRFLRTSATIVPTENMFAVMDLVRVAMADVRFSGYYAEEEDHKTIAPLLEYTNQFEDCPYALRLVTLQMACNLFSSPLYIEHILNCSTLRTPIIQLITTSLLNEKHHNVRVTAASLALNVASANAKIRTGEDREALPEVDQIELAASLLEAIGAETESHEALNGFLLAFGPLIYCATKDSELIDLLKSMDPQGTILAKKEAFPKEPLIIEIGELLGSFMIHKNADT